MTVEEVKLAQKSHYHAISILNEMDKKIAFLKGFIKEHIPQEVLEEEIDDLKFEAKCAADCDQIGEYVGFSREWGILKEILEGK